MNETLQILNIFVTRFHVTLKNFPGDGTNSFMIIFLYLIRKWYFSNRKKILKKIQTW